MRKFEKLIFFYPMFNYKLGERKRKRKKGFEEKGEDSVSSGEIRESHNKEKEERIILFYFIS